MNIKVDSLQSREKKCESVTVKAETEKEKGALLTCRGSVNIVSWLDYVSASTTLSFLQLSADLTFMRHVDNVSCLSQNFTVMTFVFDHIINRQCGWLAMPNH